MLIISSVRAKVYDFLLWRMIWLYYKDSSRVRRCYGELRCGEVPSDACTAMPRIRSSDGIALFLRLDTMDADNKKAADQTSEAYQQNYQKEQDAAAYNAKYRDRWTKRLSTWREFGLLDRMLSNQGRCKVLLDLPCGGGRFEFAHGAACRPAARGGHRGGTIALWMRPWTSPDATGVDDRVWFSHSPAQCECWWMGPSACA